MSKKPVYKDPAHSIDERVEDLLSHMTLEEKTGQLSIPFEGWKAWERINGKLQITASYRDMIIHEGTGVLYGVSRADPWTGVTLESGLSPEESAEISNLLQRIAVEETRLGIPLLLCAECNHGHMSIGSTVFPTSIGMSCTWNRKLVREAAQAIAAETRSRGEHVAFSPVLDIAQEPRWSRVEETFGEDPFLIGEMGEAVIKGYKGKGFGSDQSIMSSIKHFAAHGTPQGGLNCAPAHVGERELREVMLYPFKKCIDAGAMSIMSAYSEIDGIQCTCSRYLLTEILRNEWGFKGFAVSDGTAVEQLYTTNRIAASLDEAGKMALSAGIDLCLWDKGFSNLANMVRRGEIPESIVDRAAGNILKAKFLLGLFEKPYVEARRAKTTIGSMRHKELAEKAAHESIVLLKNNNNILPLDRNIKSIAVIGPNAGNIYNQLGDYTAPQKENGIITVLEGVRSKLQGDAVIHYARGCGIKDNSKDGFSEAIEAAVDSQVVLMVMGGSSARNYGADFSSTGAVNIDSSAVDDMDNGEGCDRSELTFAGVQLELFDSIKALGIPVIVILIKGRPMELNHLADHADAILDAWYPGQQGGAAIADILFGNVNPSGKLSVSIPKSVGQLPVYYYRKNSSLRSYVFIDSLPLYDFGFGLSYTNYSYSDLVVFPKRIRPGEQVKVSVKVKNTGRMKGKEIVQMYLSDEVASVTRPGKQLKGFEKVTLEVGEEKTVEFSIIPEYMTLLDQDMRQIIEPGIFKVMVGGNQRSLLYDTFEILEE